MGVCSTLYNIGTRKYKPENSFMVCKLMTNSGDSAVLALWTKLLIQDSIVRQKKDTGASEGELISFLEISAGVV